MKIIKDTEKRTLNIRISIFDMAIALVTVALVVFFVWAVWPRHNGEGVEAQLTAGWSNIHLSDNAAATISEKDYMFFPNDGGSPSFVGEHADELCVQFESSARNENGEFFTVYYVDVK